MASFNVKIAVNADQRGRVLSPLIHGLAIEHVGSTVYGGSWIEEGTGLSTFQGLRTDVADILRRLRPGVLRWPGDQFAATYQWTDGFGPKSERKRRANLAWGGEESNAFGTDEFVALSRKLGAEPAITVNLETGSLLDQVRWVDYCNGSGQTESTERRRMNGNPDPFGVRYWRLGSENIAPDLPWRADEYARAYQKAAALIRRTDPGAELMACCPDNPQWVRSFLSAMEPHFGLIDHLALPFRIHSAVFAGGSRSEHARDYYGLFSALPKLEKTILDTARALRDAGPNTKHIKIALDRWAVRHPEASTENGLLQPATLRDGLLAGCVLHLLHRFSKTISMANITYSTGALHALLITRKAAVIRTPTYHVFDLLKPHLDANLLPVTVSAPHIKARTDNHVFSLPSIDVLATQNTSRDHITVTLINLHLDKEAELSLYSDAKTAMSSVSAISLTSDSPNDENTIESPHHVESREADLQHGNNPVQMLLPPCSLTKLEIAF